MTHPAALLVGIVMISSSAVCADVKPFPPSPGGTALPSDIAIVSDEHDGLTVTVVYSSASGEITVSGILISPDLVFTTIETSVESGVLRAAGESLRLEKSGQVYLDFSLQDTPVGVLDALLEDYRSEQNHQTAAAVLLLKAELSGAVTARPYTQTVAELAKQEAVQFFVLSPLAGSFEEQAITVTEVTEPDELSVILAWHTVPEGAKKAEYDAYSRPGSLLLARDRFRTLWLLGINQDEKSINWSDQAGQQQIILHFTPVHSLQHLYNPFLLAPDYPFWHWKNHSGELLDYEGFNLGGGDYPEYILCQADCDLGFARREQDGCLGKELHSSYLYMKGFLPDWQEVFAGDTLPENILTINQGYDNSSISLCNQSWPVCILVFPEQKVMQPGKLNGTRCFSTQTESSSMHFLLPLHDEEEIVSEGTDYHIEVTAPSNQAGAGPLPVGGGEIDMGPEIPEPGASGKTQSWVIAIATSVPMVLITCVATAGFAIYRFCRKSPGETGNLPEGGNAWQDDALIQPDMPLEPHLPELPPISVLMPSFSSSLEATGGERMVSIIPDKPEQTRQAPVLKEAPDNNTPLNLENPYAGRLKCASDPDDDENMISP